MRSGRWHPEDDDLRIADALGVDPYQVDHVWPADLRQRALALIEARARHQQRQQMRRGG